MQRGIGKDGVELILERDSAGVHHPGVQTALPRRRNHVRSTIDAHNAGAGRHELFGKCPVSATQIEDAFTRLRLEQVQHRLAKRRHKVRVGRVAGRIPALCGNCLRGRRRRRIGHRGKSSLVKVTSQ